EPLTVTGLRQLEDQLGPGLYGRQVVTAEAVHVRGRPERGREIPRHETQYSLFLTTVKEPFTIGGVRCQRYRRRGRSGCSRPTAACAHRDGLRPVRPGGRRLDERGRGHPAGGAGAWG